MNATISENPLREKRQLQSAEESNPKKRKRYEEKPHRANRREERREVMTKAKNTWEKLRPKAITKQKSRQLVDELFNLLKSRIVEFVFRHDGSRIVQWMLAEGSQSQRDAIMSELMNDEAPGGADQASMPFFLRLVCDRYGHHLALKMLRVADKKNKSLIFERYLKGHASQLIRNANGADVLDVAYQTMLNSRAKSELVIELLYSKEHKLLDTVRSKLFSEKNEAEKKEIQQVSRCIFAESLELVGDTFKDVVVESAANTISQLLDKENLLGFEVVHAAVKQYFQVVIEMYPKQKAEDLAVLIGPSLVHFAHTKSGAYVAVNCVKVLDAKHRKKVVRSLKTHIRKLIEDEFGHRVILALFEWVDDTRLVGKMVSTEIFSKSKLVGELNDGGDTQKASSRGGRSKAEKKGKGKTGNEKKKSDEDGMNVEEGVDMEYMKQMCMHKYGRMCLLSLFVGRDTRYFNPDVYGVVWDHLDIEKFGKRSKKDADVRRKELRGMFEGAVKMMMKNYMGSLLQCRWSAAVVLGALTVEETKDGVVQGLKECMDNEEGLKQVVESCCGRKTMATMFKVGGKELACGVLDGCGIQVMGRFAASEGCMAIMEQLVAASGRSDARKAMERIQKEI